MRRVRHMLLAAVVAVTAIGLTSCSSGTRPGTDPSQNDFEDAAAKVLRGAAADPAAPGGPDEAYDRGQRHLVDCMRAAGFTYHPAPAPVSQSAALGLTDRQFKVKYGYGISTLIDSRQAQDSHAAEDPNDAERKKLSEAQQAAYAKAMRECEQKVMIDLRVIPGGRLRLLSGSPLDKAISGAAEAAEADPRVADVVSRWAACMRQQGFGYARAEALNQDLETRVAPLRQAYVAQGQPLVEAGATWDRLTVAEVLTRTQLDQLKKVQVFELSAAAADLRCADQGIVVAKVVNKVHQEYLEKALEGF
jgi:hypothetical protein